MTSLLKIFRILNPIIVVSISALISSVAIAKPVVSDTCGNPNLIIKNATPQELASACNSFEDLTKKFLNLGFDPKLKVQLIFENKVFLPNPDGTLSDTEVYGYFDSDTFEMHMAHFNSPIQKNRKPWGLQWNSQTAESLLLHEISHLMIISLMYGHEKIISHAWHEAMAYYIQLSSLNLNQQNKILANFKSATAFSDEDSITDFAHEAAPEEFAVRSFLYFKNHSGMNLVKTKIQTPLNLKYRAECILKAAAKNRKIILKDSIPMPVIHFQSKTPLSYYIEVFKKAYGEDSKVFMNRYLPTTNEIFMVDSPINFRNAGRTIDDSLAHEFVHFLQVKYENRVEEDEEAETEAIRTQTWFRETYMTPQDAASPCF